MRKRIMTQASAPVSPAVQDWLELERLAQVEVTSEDAAYPIEAALLAESGAGWRAAQPGEQTIRLLFDKPLTLRRIQLLFIETAATRTQEFLLRWSHDGGQTYRELVRQQYNFAPTGGTRELEDFNVTLEGATVLELRIIPDIRGGAACASLAQLRLA